MSQTLKKKIGIFFLILMLSFFMFGCDKTTPVDDIYFNLGEGEQIVLIVGQTLNLEDYVVIRPNYASNKKYTITSFNENIIQVDNHVLKAVNEGVTQIQVVSEDNNLKVDMMTVNVRKTKTTLNAPRNLVYDNVAQTLSFDTVPNATSYTLKINGSEIELGNSNVYNLSQYKNFAPDTLMVAQVRANSPAYTFALESSVYSDEIKIYQAGSVNEIKVEDGVLSFVKSISSLKANIYIQDVLFVEETTETNISLKNLNEIYAGMELTVKVETFVDEETKNNLGNDVLYFNSIKKSVKVNVLDIPDIKISSTTLSWQNISYCSKYSIFIDGTEREQTTENYFDLKSLDDFETLIAGTDVHEIKVIPELGEGSANIATTSKVSELKVKRLETLNLECLGSNIEWQDVENASVYAISLSGEGVNIATSTNLSQFSMNGYDPNEYTITVQAIAKEVADADGVYYISSNAATKEFVKHESVDASIANYVLNVANFASGNVSVKFDDETYNQMLVGDGSEKNIDLSSYVFEVGEHTITLTKLGDENSVDGTSTVLNFVQLEKAENVEIQNGKLVVERSSVNENAIITILTIGAGMASPFIIEDDEILFNTSDNTQENFLFAGAYTSTIYVYGDGSSTFSYREGGAVVVCASVGFEVLDAPTLKLEDVAVEEISFNEVVNASSYDVYLVDGNFTLSENITTTNFEFELASGSVSYSAQAKGDGIYYLDSRFADVITITRLQTPTLSYNNATNVISKIDTNDASVVREYIFKHNGSVVDYDFTSAFALTTDSVITLQAIAINGDGENYYLNSFVHTLNLEKISNEVTISLDELNNLVIAPVAHEEQYDLEIVFGFGGIEQTFTTHGNELKNGSELLNYVYAEGQYVIELVNDEHNAVLEGLKNEFTVKVRFVKNGDGSETTINSEFTPTQTFNLIKIDNQTTIFINDSNEIVVSPANHNQEYGLIVVVNNGEELTFVSNGEKLICEDIELDYIFDVDTKSYYITLLSENYNSIIEDLTSNFTVKVKYTYNHGGILTDLDSNYSYTQEIEVLPVATLIRDGQNLKIANVKATYTHLNYALYINEEYVLNLQEEYVLNQEGYLIFDVEFIYSNTPAEHLKEVNSVSVIVLNVETSSSNPELSMKGENIYISKAQTVTISSYKFNNNEDGKNNNSSVVTFETNETDYNKQYVVEIYNIGGENKQVKRYIDADATDDKISFNMDSILNIEGMIYVVAYVTTADSYVDGNTIQVFNSVKSNEIHLERINQVTNLTVSNSKLTFAMVANCVGYEIYEKTASTYTKLNNGLVTGNEYTISNTTGKKQIVVKAISETDGYTNASYSDVLTINKLATPTLSVVEGKFKVGLSTDILLLMLNENVNVIPEISNSQDESITVDLKNLQDGTIKLQGTNLIIEPYLFVSYNSESLIAEDINVQIRVEYAEPVNDVYYLNSDMTKIAVHGLFKPTAISKTTQNNDSVELITWTPSNKNVLNGEALSVGYVFKIQYSKEGTDVTYYSNDTKLKYYDSVTSTYKSYATYISGTSTVFPAGYDEDNDGTLDILFEEGMYKVSVQAVPTGVVTGYNLCSSDYTDAYEFEILKKIQMFVEDGKVLWTAQDKASKYIVTVYEGEETEAKLIDTVSVAEYDFTNASLKGVTGVLRVTVKAISISVDALNSKESEPIYVYRLPEANEVHVDDGQLVLTSTEFFNYAKIEFVDNTTNTICVEMLDNEDRAVEALELLNISSWKGFVENAKIDATIKTAINLDGEVLNILDGRDYSINVTLYGNSNISLGFINSSKSSSISNMTATKLKPNATEISLGVVQYMPNSDYATISEEGVYSGIDLNYSFNGETSSAFWENTAVYKIEMTYSLGVANIYAVDYYSFITAINNGTIQAGEYELFTNANNLYAVVKYDYTEEGESKTIYFNVYEENTINLRDYDFLRYYPVAETMTDGVNKFVGSSEYNTIDLEAGGSYTLNIYMLGGDSTSGLQQNAGHLSATANKIKTFVRYSVNELTSYEGKIQFNNLLPIVEEKTIDNPVYKIVVKLPNSTDSKIFYLYHSTEEDARKVAQRHDNKTYSTATYVQVEAKDGLDGVLFFDLSQHIVDGTYTISIRTLAGLGSYEEDDANYLLNAKIPGVEYTFYKLTDTYFGANKGVLEFAQSYISQDSTKIYNDNYEVTLYDVSLDRTHIYQINRLSDGVKINDSTHVVSYALPAQISVGDDVIVVDGDKDYQIKIRAMATDNYVLNGTYKKQANADVEFAFKKSLGISEISGEDLRIEDGILKWKVVDPDNYTSTVIKISFLDENSQIKHLYITVGNANRVEENGVYKYHYYEFTDEKYNLETTGSVYINSGINYTLSAYITGSNNILNSNYSSEITHERIQTVDSSTIKTTNGVLVWEEVENAVAYKVTIIGESTYAYTTNEARLDLLETDLNLPVGSYSVNIKALGDTYINSMVSVNGTGFTQLAKVDPLTIDIVDADLVWEEVEGAQGYLIKFAYTSVSGEEQNLSEVVLTNSYTAPRDISGKFIMQISAVGVGDGKLFNGQPISYTSSSDAPMQVQKLEFDEENSRFVITLNRNEFLDSDTLLFVYNFAEYISNSSTSNNTLIQDKITYQQAGRYENVDDSIVKYYYPITVMGQYTNIYVQVTRTGAIPSNAVETDDVDFKLFSHGAGTVENPYRIYSAMHLLNIKYFTSANYVLTSSINLTGVDLNERLTVYDAIISSEFSGVLDGDNFAILGFNVNKNDMTDITYLTDVTNFALFGTLNDATIKNLTIGQENIQLILSNTFAFNTQNVINLSLIATGANNSIIDSVKVLDAQINIQASAGVEKSNGGINVAGLVVNAFGTTITNSTIKLTVNITEKCSSNVEILVGGMIANATTSNITSSNVTFELTSRADNLFSYVGGVVATYTGNMLKTTGITNTNVDFTMSNIQVINVGGLVGFARYIKIDSCETTGSYQKHNIGYYTYIGGLVGYAQSSTISESGSFIEFDLTLSNNNGDKFIGSIVGELSVYNNTSCELINCYSHTYSSGVEKTNINNGTLEITLGIYGATTGNNITVTGCYNKQK